MTNGQTRVPFRRNVCERYRAAVSRSIVDSIRPKTQTAPFPDINDSNFLLFLFPLFFFSSFFSLSLFFFFFFFARARVFPATLAYRFSAISRHVKALLKNICVKFHTSKCYVKFPELLDKQADRQTDRQTDGPTDGRIEREGGERNASGRPGFAPCSEPSGLHREMQFASIGGRRSA